MNMGKLVGTILIIVGIAPVGVGIWLITDRDYITGLGFLSLFFGLALMVAGIFVIVKSKSKETQVRENTKKCPFCANDIKKEAVVCQFCNKELPKA